MPKNTECTTASAYRVLPHVRKRSGSPAVAAEPVLDRRVHRCDPLLLAGLARERPLDQIGRDDDRMPQLEIAQRRRGFVEIAAIATGDKSDKGEEGNQGAHRAVVLGWIVQAIT